MVREYSKGNFAGETKQTAPSVFEMVRRLEGTGATVHLIDRRAARRFSTKESGVR
jgi:hypothetical protein